MEAEVKNAADSEQVSKANKKELYGRKQELSDLKTVLATAQGRRLLWRLLGKCNTFKSIFSHSGSVTSYNAGQQDFGHYLLAEIEEADQNALFIMMQDSRKDNDNA